MAPIVYYREIVWTVKLMAEVCKFLDQGCVPTVGRYLEVVGSEVKLVPEKVSQLSYLLSPM